jgi:hypothetical protein
MALIRCRECRREISSKSAACPGCGAPVTTKSGPATGKVNVVRPGAGWERLGFLTIILGLLAFIFGGGHIIQIGAFGMAAGFVIFVIGRLLS